MMDFSFYTFDQLDAATLYEIIAHRMEVFVLGQGNIYRDLDGFDQKATHLLARDETGALVGYVRLLPAALHYDGHDHNSFGRSPGQRPRGRAGAPGLRQTGAGFRRPGGGDLRHGLSGRFLPPAGL